MPDSHDGDMDESIDQMFEELEVERETDREGVVIVRNSGAIASMRRARVGESVYLMLIRTDRNQQGRGHASELLAEICNAADRNGVCLFLEVEKGDDGNLSESQLMDWYWRFGFRGEREEMVREPQTK